MPVEGQVLFRTREDIVQALIEGLISRVPDAYVDEDGNTFLLFSIVGDTTESVFIAIQITADDMFVSTASPSGLIRHGDEFSVPMLFGTKSTGYLLFTGNGGTVIPEATEAAYDPGTGDDPLYFITSEEGTIPNPGSPTAPTLADGGGSGNLVAGTYEYVVTFLTAAGETAAGTDSLPLTIAASHKITVSAIPLGGPGTTGRKIYRSKDGGSFLLCNTINDVITTTFLDNLIDASLGVAAPSTTTAERISIASESEDVGAKYNLLSNTITVLTNAPDGVTSVVNSAAFTTGSDAELTEDYRSRLLTTIRAPGTGSPTDIEAWALEVIGVGSATVFENDNMGTPTNGHVTVRISAPDGSVPGAGVIADTLAALNAKGMANMTFHVGTFTPITEAVTVDVTTQTGYVLGDVSPAVDLAIKAYINSIDVGGTVYIAGIVQAIMSVVGVADVTVSVPATNQVEGATEKPVPGTITIT